MSTVKGAGHATRRLLPATLRHLGACAGNEVLEVTLVLRRRRPLKPPVPRLTRAELAAQYGADPADVARLRKFGTACGLAEQGCDMACRTLRWRGSVDALQKAFHVRLGRYVLLPGGMPFIGCTAEPVLPDRAVIAVLGLDRRPVAHPHFRVAQAQPAATYSPPQIGEIYAFPAGDGTGETVAIIELGGGYPAGDLDTYFRGLGLKTPTVTAVSVDGGSNQPGSSADAEVELDIEIAGALAQGATFAVYFAPNTDQGFYDAIAQAAHAAGTTVMSISWGGPEDSWATASRSAMETALEDAAALGVTVCVAAGDSGSSDGETGNHVDYPASSASVLGCGGTRLTANGTAIASEAVWNEMASGEGATGGGVSAVFALPSWQSDAKVPKGAGGFVGRGVPDVAGNADPLTGYAILVDDQTETVGGTSAVAPLWAALIARMNQQLGKSLGAANAALYALAGKGFHDVTQGTNGAFSAGPGWDACTGWGSPNGTVLLSELSGAASKPVTVSKPRPVKPKSTPTPKPMKPKPGPGKAAARARPKRSNSTRRVRKRR